MKKFIFVMPLMSISLLASCGGSNPEPTPETTYTITFKNEGDEDKKIENIKAGSIITENVPTPITPKPDSTFIGWCTDTESKYPFDFSKIKIYQDYTLYSGWKDNRPSTCKVTFDAGEGSYDEGQTISVDVAANTKLVPLLKKIKIPACGGNIFSYYNYENGEIIDYDDVITSDITVKANYQYEPYYPNDMDSLDWKSLKCIAVTNSNPSSCFRADDYDMTKTVQVNGLNHKVRIIDFNHDKDINGNLLGITFEFADVITGDELKQQWNAKGDSPTNYDYRDSTLNEYLNGTKDGDTSGTVLKMLPDGLRDVIAPADKKVLIHEDNTYVAKSFAPDYPCPKLFPLSSYEMARAASAEEGDQYKFYKNCATTTNDKFIKKVVGGDSGAMYWSRSPNPSFGETRAWYVGNDCLNPNAPIADFYYVAPAFCI